MTHDPSVEEAIHLESLGGEPAPVELREDMRELVSLPLPVQRGFWPLLAPFLDGEPSQDDLAGLFSRCEEHGLDPERLKLPIRGVRYLLTHAAGRGLPPAQLTNDIDRLIPFGYRRVAYQLLLNCYEQLRART